MYEIITYYYNLLFLNHAFKSRRKFANNKNYIFRLEVIIDFQLIIAILQIRQYWLIF